MSVLVRALVGAEERMRTMLLIASRGMRPRWGCPRMCRSCGTWEHGTIFATISGGDQSCRLIHWRLSVTARRRFFWGVHAALALCSRGGDTRDGTITDAGNLAVAGKGVLRPWIVVRKQAGTRLSTIRTVL